MNIFIIIAIVVVVLIVLFILFNGNPKGYADGIAKAQLRSYKIVQLKHPDWSKEHLYREIISARSGYNKSKVDNIIRLAKENANLMGDKLSLREVAFAIAQNEFYERTNSNNIPNGWIEKWTIAIHTIIPDNI